MEVMIIKWKTCHLTSILTKSRLSWKSIITFQNSDTWKIALSKHSFFKRYWQRGCKHVLNMISFVNAQSSLKIGIVGSKVLLLIISCSNIVTWLDNSYVKGDIFFFQKVYIMKVGNTFWLNLSHKAISNIF